MAIYLIKKLLQYYCNIALFINAIKGVAVTLQSVSALNMKVFFLSHSSSVISLNRIICGIWSANDDCSIWLCLSILLQYPG